MFSMLRAHQQMHVDLWLVLSPPCFGLSCGHLKGDENKSKNTILICPNHSTRKNYKVFC